jgi:hypothetical protein
MHLFSNERETEKEIKKITERARERERDLGELSV